MIVNRVESRLVGWLVSKEAKGSNSTVVRGEPDSLQDIQTGQLQEMLSTILDSHQILALLMFVNTKSILRCKSHERVKSMTWKSTQSAAHASSSLLSLQDRYFWGGVRCQGTNQTCSVIAIRILGAGEKLPARMGKEASWKRSLSAWESFLSMQYCIALIFRGSKIL